MKKPASDNSYYVQVIENEPLILISEHKILWMGKATNSPAARLFVAFSKSRLGTRYCVGLRLIWQGKRIVESVELSKGFRNIRAAHVHINKTLLASGRFHNKPDRR